MIKNSLVLHPHFQCYINMYQIFGIVTGKKIRSCSFKHKLMWQLTITEGIRSHFLPHYIVFIFCPISIFYLLASAMTAGSGSAEPYLHQWNGAKHGALVSMFSPLRDLPTPVEAEGRSTQLKGGRSSILKRYIGSLISWNQSFQYFTTPPRNPVKLLCWPFPRC